MKLSASEAEHLKMKSEIFSPLNINFAPARRRNAKRQLQNTKLLVTAKRQLRLASRMSVVQVGRAASKARLHKGHGRYSVTERRDALCVYPSYRPSSTCWAQASTKRRVSSRHVIGPRAMMAGDVSEAADTMFGCASGRQGGERPDLLVP